MNSSIGKIRERKVRSLEQMNGNLVLELIYATTEYEILELKCEIDLFIMQGDSKKVFDPNKQNSLSSALRLRTELIRPLRVAVVSSGPDTELLIANPMEDWL